jgi:uncharacterized protein (DUF924 family)
MTGSEAKDADWVDDVLGFWFKDLSPKDWYQRSEETDALVRRRFGLLYENFSRSPPELEGATARIVLAAIIVLDQFPRNLFRDSAKAFATDGMALLMAEGAVDRGLDRLLTTLERQCLYLPFQHSEKADVQTRSCTLYAALGEAESLEYAKRHKEVIDRFGRFPHRNQALGRQSSTAELAFLGEPNSSF